MGSVHLLNRDWAFHLGDCAGAEAPEYDDSAWRRLDLPHDWSIEGSFDPRWASATAYLPGGTGWYRKRFTPPPAAAGQHLFVHFDGVYANSDVWLNGQHLGQRPSGFAGFRYELTPYLLADRPNLLAVRADHRAFADARWYTGSGIYRKVTLISAGALRIAQWGVFATTAVLDDQAARLRVAVTVENRLEAQADLAVVCALHDPQGRLVAQVQRPALLAAQSAATLELTLEVMSPLPWSVDRPWLYELRTAIQHAGAVADSETTPVGLRVVRFDPDQGMFLNGQSLKLKGVCVHDDAGALGVAVPPEVWERRLKLLKAAGVNAIRMAHNPHMPELYDLCDRLGLLVQDEAFDEWELSKNKWVAGWNVGEPAREGSAAHFAAWAETDLADMVRAHRNHPSVIMWSIGNEIDYPNDPYSHEVLDHGTTPQIVRHGYRPEHPHASRLGPIARRLREVVRQYDPSRPVTAGLASALIANQVGLADALDLVGYNYQEYRYADDHATYPQRILYGSENGMHWQDWRAVVEHPFIAGQFLWTGIDYLGEAGQWPARSNTAGLLDLAGFPKPEYYFRQSIWTDKPMIFIGTAPARAPSDTRTIWQHKEATPLWEGTPGEPVAVRCFTNCTAAELFLNGRSLGVRCQADASEGVLSWVVPYEPGVLSANGLGTDAVLCRAVLQTSGPPRRLAIEVDRQVLRANRADLAHVAVQVLDAQGVLVYRADTPITWRVEGPARLLGIESGDHQSHEPYQAPLRRVFHGRQLGYIQATGAPGRIRVTLTAPGIAVGSCSLDAV